MYTSYRGMRSTVSDGSAASRWSLLALIQLLVGIKVHILAPSTLLSEPRIEPGRDQAIRALLLLRRADGEEVGVFILDVLVVAPDPAPIHRVMRRHLRERLPQLEILERTGLASPAPGLPGREPFGHPLDQILGVGNEAHMGVAPLAADPLQRRYGAGQCHAVVRGLR